MFRGQLRWPDAIGNLQTTISIHEAQARRDPASEQYLNSQPDLYATLADCFAAAGQRTSAITAVQTAINRFGQIEAGCPLVPEEEETRRSYAARLSDWQAASIHASN